jgi:CHRD domain
MKQSSLKLFTFLLLSATVFSCKKDSTPDPVAPVTTVNFAATVNGASEVPVNASTATGTALAVFDKTTKILTLSLTYSGLTATAMHIHKGPAGVGGGVLFGLSTAPFTSPIAYTSPALSAGQEDSLMNNLYYINIHSSSFPAGEIRGQITKQ